MKITYDKTKYYKYAFEFQFDMAVVDFCRSVKEQYGWQNFTFNDKKWRFNDYKLAAIIKGRYPSLSYDDSFLIEAKKDQLKEEEQKVKDLENVKLKTATKSNLRLENIKGNLYDYQKLATEFVINNNGRSLIALDMGLGKSLVSLAYCAHTNKKKILVICPASVKWSWESEVAKWTNLKSIVISSNTHFDIKSFTENNVFIINYDILKKFYDILIGLPFDVMIVDESTYIKSIKAIRSKIVKKLSTNIENILLLSGTPMLSKPVELFTSLNILDPKVWNNYLGYIKKYCGAWQAPWMNGGWDASRATNIPELKERLAKYMFRKKKEDVLQELPDKRFIDVPVEMSDEVQIKYNKAEENFVNYLLEIKKKDDSEVRRSMMAETLVKLNEMRQLCSEGKIDSSLELVETIIESGEKVIVFSAYNKPLLDLKAKLKNSAVMIIGSSSEQERKEAVEKFQNDDKIRVFLGGMNSANTGITLTAASNVLFVDYDWVPANMEQAYGRAHRIGNKAESLSIYQMIAKGTIDQKVAKVLEKKKELFSDLIEDEELIKTKSTSMIKDIIKLFEEKNTDGNASQKSTQGETV